MNSALPPRPRVPQAALAESLGTNEPVGPDLMSSVLKASNAEITRAYKNTKSIYVVAKKFGMCPQSVQERLVKMGIPRSKPKFSLLEIKRLELDYLVYRDAGKLNELATLMGRSKHLLARQAGKLGLTDPRGQKRWNSKWKYLTRESALVIWEEFKRSSYGMVRFCEHRRYTQALFSTTMKKHFPEEWDHVLELKAPKQLPYHRGRAFEYRIKDKFKDDGYFVIRSAQSRSPVDLVAFRPGRIVFIQCKRSQGLPAREWNILYSLASSCGAVAIFAEIVRGKTRLWEMIGTKSPGDRDCKKEWSFPE